MSVLCALLTRALPRNRTGRGCLSVGKNVLLIRGCGDPRILRCERRMRECQSGVSTGAGRAAFSKTQSLRFVGDGAAQTASSRTRRLSRKGSSPEQTPAPGHRAAAGAHVCAGLRGNSAAGRVQAPTSGGSRNCSSSAGSGDLRLGSLPSSNSWGALVPARTFTSASALRGPVLIRVQCQVPRPTGAPFSGNPFVNHPLG